MKIPLLSVCLITYNHEKYIRQAIEGVLCQKVDFDWEFIIADDFSTDGTRAIIIEYKEKFPELIKLILQEKNVGPGRNWFDLMEAPKSKYIAYFEGDDYWIDEKKLQKQVDFLENNTNCVFCFHKAYRISPNNLNYKDVYPKSVNNTIVTTEEFFTIPTIPTASLVYRNQTILNDFIHHSQGDFVLYCTMLSKGFAGYLDEIMSVYRLHEKGVSSKYNENWYLIRRIKELDIEKKHIHFSRKVRKEIDKVLVDHILYYLNKNRGKLNFKVKLQYFMILIRSHFFYIKSFKEYLKLMKTLIK